MMKLITKKAAESSTNGHFIFFKSVDEYGNFYIDHTITPFFFELGDGDDLDEVVEKLAAERRMHRGYVSNPIQHIRAIMQEHSTSFDEACRRLPVRLPEDR